MKRGDREKTKTRSNAFGDRLYAIESRLNAFAFFHISPFHEEGHMLNVTSYLPCSSGTISSAESLRCHCRPEDRSPRPEGCCVLSWLWTVRECEGSCPRYNHRRCTRESGRIHAYNITTSSYWKSPRKSSPTHWAVWNSNRLQNQERGLTISARRVVVQRGGRAMRNHWTAIRIKVHVHYRILLVRFR